MRRRLGRPYVAMMLIRSAETEKPVQLIIHPKQRINTRFAVDYFAYPLTIIMFNEEFTKTPVNTMAHQARFQVVLRNRFYGIMGSFFSAYRTKGPDLFSLLKIQHLVLQCLGIAFSKISEHSPNLALGKYLEFTTI